MQRFLKLILLLIFILFFTACGNGSVNDLNITNPQTVGNKAPIADAGTDQNVSLNAIVGLDGSGSSDSDGDTLTYLWSFAEKPSGSNPILSNEKIVNPTFQAKSNGVYILSLTVNDSKQNSLVASTVSITVTSFPVANAGADQNVFTLSKVTLDASSSSVSQEKSLSYLWTFTSKPTDSTAVLSSRTIVNPTFVADKNGTYQISLIVNDGTQSSSPDTVLISANRKNIAPIADAGDNQNVKIDDSVTLDGSKSFDANADMLTYKWKIVQKPLGSLASLSNIAVVQPSVVVDLAGTYVFGLQVNDGEMDSSLSSVTIQVSNANSAPIADAGKTQEVYTTTYVTLDGSASSDVDHNILTYNWSIVSQPEGSSSTLIHKNTINPSFLADTEGTYVFSLLVSDAVLNSNYAYVSVNAKVKNVPPVANAGSSQNVKISSSKDIYLDASLSSDANLDILKYNWLMVSKPVKSISSLVGTNISNPHFKADVVGTYVFQLIVSDIEFQSAPDYVTVTATAENSIPQAKAGDDQSVTTLSTVMLNGSLSSDADADHLTYIWYIVSKPVDSNASLSDNGIVNPTFVADKDGTYSFELIVNDGTSNSLADTVLVTATTTNATPIAKIADNQEVKTGSVVVLNGAKSYDADYDALTYRWIIVSLPTGSNTTISNPTLVSTTMIPDSDGTYVVGLGVNDGIISSKIVYTTIVATKENTKPIANAGIDKNVSLGATVTLTALASSDIDGDSLTYSWSMISLPSTSSAQLSSTTAAEPTFVADKDGAYVFELIVSDGKAESTRDYITVNAQ